MLSLLGSIQPDPFSPEHVPETGKGDKAESEAEDLEVQQEIEPGEEDDDEIESDEDTFKALKEKGAAVARQAAEAAVEVKKEMKRKRRIDKAEEKKQKRTKS